jgi:hypothetical protein
MVLKHGHYYKTRSGDVVEVKKDPNNSLFYYLDLTGEPTCVSADGRYYLNADSNFDLIEYVPPRIQQLRQLAFAFISYLGRTYDGR